MKIVILHTTTANHGEAIGVVIATGTTLWLLVVLLRSCALAIATAIVIAIASSSLKICIYGK